MTKKKDDLLTIPTFLDRKIDENIVAVMYKMIDDVLYKVDANGQCYTAKNNRLKKGKKYILGLKKVQDG